MSVTAIESWYRIFMPKKPLSVTLEASNLLWLRGRAVGRKKRSLSDALDEILTTARLGGTGGEAPRSVVGTIDITPDDPALERAGAAVRALFDESLSRPVLVRDEPARFGTAPGPSRARRQPSSPKARRG
jgi:hypothetical protein